MWFKAHVQGTPRIVIDLSDQMAYFYRGGRLAGMSPVSTGKPGHRTPTGNFRISEKKYSHRSNLYGHYISPRGYVLRSNVDVRRHRKPAGSRFRGASMDYMMRINGPVTMHAGYVPGYPASHGCIRLPWHMAKTFYRHARVGTKVSVVP
ncbi:L,D-transpeptidase family protein [Microbulbifer epialgicus]|uniref:L,D-transpeptidase family protein n=1 Tax=Microbulbifer epialgicus TaxID=393907 RepID=A0ABV4P2H1_9GAMM